MIYYFGVLAATLVVAGYQQIVGKGPSLSAIERRKRVSAGRGLSQRSEGSPIRRFGFADLIVLGILVTFLAARDDVGTDYDVYLYTYVNLPVDDLLLAMSRSGQEPGFVLLMMICRTVFESERAIFWAAATLTVVPTYIALKRASPLMPLSAGLYITLGSYLFSFNGVRQGIAIAMLLLAVVLFREGRKVLPLLLAGASASFHVSAILAVVVLVVIRKWRPSVVSAAALVMGASAFSLVFGQLGILRAIVSRLNERYVVYLDASGAGGIGALLQIAAHLGLVIYALLIVDRRDAADHNRGVVSFYMAIVLVGIAAMIIGTQSVVVGRFSGYFLIFQLLLLPSFVARSRAPLLHSVVFLIASTIYFVAYLLNYGELIPYRSYW